MTVILKIVKSPYLNEKSSAFGEMCTEEQMCNSMTVTWPNIEKKLKFRIDGGLPKRSVFGHNSTTDCPISVKLCVGKQFLSCRTSAMGPTSAFHRTYFLFSSCSVVRWSILVSSPINLSCADDVISFTANCDATLDVTAWTWMVKCLLLHYSCL